MAYVDQAEVKQVDVSPPKIYVEDLVQFGEGLIASTQGLAHLPWEGPGIETCEVEKFIRTACGEELTNDLGYYNNPSFCNVGKQAIALGGVYYVAGDARYKDIWAIARKILVRGKDFPRNTGSVFIGQEIRGLNALEGITWREGFAYAVSGSIDDIVAIPPKQFILLQRVLLDFLSSLVTLECQTATSCSIGTLLIGLHRGDYTTPDLKARAAVLLNACGVGRRTNAHGYGELQPRTGYRDTKQYLLEKIQIEREFLKGVIDGSISRR